jgi:subtilisin family serine protease
MIRRSLLSLAPLALVAAALAACSRDAADAVRSAAAAPPRVDAAAAGARYVVAFRGAPPADFAGRVAALGGTVELSHADAGIATVAGLSDAAAAQLRAGPGIDDVVADEESAVDPPVGDAVATEMPADAASLGSVEASAANPAGAFFFPRQWDYRAIGANLAWAAGALGSPDVTVAILDTGIDYTHPDLAGRVDLSRSRSFIPSDDALVAALFPGANPIADLQYHGTHVAATVSSNAVAAAGMTSRVRLIGVKVLSRTGSGPTSAALNGVLWAADHGADVINMSLTTSFTRPGQGRFVSLLNRVLRYATRKGALVVVAAGNQAWDLDHDGNLYAAYCDNPAVVCVSATGPTASAGTNGPWTNVDAPAPYTNYGRSAITVAAPGGQAANVTAACSRFSLALPICRTGVFVVGLTGTSQATPHVSGLAALLVERIGHGRPSQVRAAIQQGADDLGQPGTDPFYGKGRINVPNTLHL